MTTSSSTVAFLILLALALIITPLCCTRIDAGHTGIKVKLTGSDKGVQQATEVTGWVFYWFLSYKVYEFPTYVQNAVFTADEEEGSPTNEEFRVNTKDGMVARFDVSINYRIEENSAPDIFMKYRKPLDELSHTIVRNYMRDGFNYASGLFTAEQMYEDKNRFVKISDSMIRTILDPEHFMIEQVVLLNEIRLDTTVMKNIIAKVSARQIALQKDMEIQQAKADAQKKIERARGDSASFVISAAGEAKAFELKQRQLNELLVQQELVQKWDGKLPIYGEVPKLFYNIQK